MYIYNVYTGIISHHILSIVYCEEMSCISNPVYCDMN